MGRKGARFWWRWGKRERVWGTRSSRLGDVVSVREMFIGRGEEGRELGWVAVAVDWGCVGGLDVGVEASARRTRDCESGASEVR